MDWRFQSVRWPVVCFTKLFVTHFAELAAFYLCGHHFAGLNLNFTKKSWRTSSISCLISLHTSEFFDMPFFEACVISTEVIVRNLFKLM